MNLRKLCPGFLFPLAQKTLALKSILQFHHYKRICKADPLRVLMLCPSRSTLSGNCAYIAKALEHTEFTLDTVLEHDGTSPKELLRKMASAGTVIVDDYTKMMYPLSFPKTTKVVQVWHSTGAFKRMGFARVGKRGSTKPNSLTHHNYTHVTVSSPGVVEDFAWAFGIEETNIYPIGVPRTDLFFDEIQMEQCKKEFYQSHPECIGKKLVLFAPTFRGDTRADAHYPAEFLNIEALMESLPDDYMLGLKLHPFIARKPAIPQHLQHRVVDLGQEREINHLLFAAELLITDYSSVIFEYAFLQKPIIFYVPDLAEYDRDRSFFYGFDTYMYGEKITKQEDLPAAIANAKVDFANREAFFEKFLSACDGNSTARFVSRILRGEEA